MLAGRRWVLGIAVGFALIEIAASLFGPYGYFIDELYYLACTKRLALGYVDHPPLSIVVLAAVRAILGQGQTVIRLPAIVAGAGAIVVTGMLARRLGGGTFAQALAALAFALAPLPLVLSSFASMNAFELLFWALLWLAFVVFVDRQDGRFWLAVGAIIGLGLENKHTMVLAAAALAFGVAATPARAALKTRWPWLGLVVAVVLFAPNAIWQATHGFVSLEFYRSAQALKNVPTSPLGALANQVQVIGPGAFAIAIAGAIWLLRAGAARPYRALGVAFAALFALAIFSGSSRPDRIAGAYPIALAAGAVAIERFADAHRRWVRYPVPALLVLFGAPLLPLALPALAPPLAALYGEKLGIVPKLERGRTSPLPQWLADRTGWAELAGEVDLAIASLTPEQRAHAAVFTVAYGQAGAIERFGTWGVPVISSQNSYWTWGPGSPEVLVMVGGGDRVGDVFEHVEVFSVHRCTYCMSWRNRMPIVIATQPKAPLATVWPALKHFE